MRVRCSCLLYQHRYACMQDLCLLCAPGGLAWKGARLLRDLPRAVPADKGAAGPTRLCRPKR